MIGIPGLSIPRRRRAAAASYPLLNNLVAYWNLSEASGQRNDSHTNGLHLTDNNTVTTGTGPDGGTAASFAAASGEYLSRSHDAYTTINGSDFSFSAWVYLADKSAAYTIVARRATSTSGEYTIVYDNGLDRFGFYLMPTGGGVGTYVVCNNYGAPPITTWVHIVAWWHNAARTGYIAVNNGAADSATVGYSIGTVSTLFLIGAQQSPVVYHHNGRMAYAGFWKRLLTASERTWLYNSGSGRNYAAVAAYTG